MDSKGVGFVYVGENSDKDESKIHKEGFESGGEGVQKSALASEAIQQVKTLDSKDKETIQHGKFQRNVDGHADVNMEADITSEDVARAGGFGARDDIGSFLPVASDSTDFEATLRDARDYEGPQEAKSRPGLGWRDSAQTE